MTGKLVCSRLIANRTLLRRHIQTCCKGKGREECGKGYWDRPSHLGVKWINSLVTLRRNSAITAELCGTLHQLQCPALWVCPLRSFFRPAGCQRGWYVCQLHGSKQSNLTVTGLVRRLHLFSTDSMLEIEFPKLFLPRNFLNNNGFNIMISSD